MTPAYVDTGLLVKLYAPEPNSFEAIRLIQSYAAPLPLTGWQELELRTALRVKAFRRMMDAVSLQSSLNDFQEDISAGRWQRSSYSDSDVFRHAEDLSHRFAGTLGCRTFDILHVAAAWALGLRDFLTSDARQAALAGRVGLRVQSV